MFRESSPRRVERYNPEINFNYRDAPRCARGASFILTIAEQVFPVNAPLIIAGDFNDTPNSAIYHLFSGKLQNAFAKAGWGLGGTFGHKSLVSSVPEKGRFLLFDFLRIDHVFCSKDFNVCGAKVLKFNASDHRPQIIDLRLKNIQNGDQQQVTQ